MRRRVLSVVVVTAAILAQCSGAFAAPAGQRAEGHATAPVRPSPSSEPTTATPQVNQPPEASQPPAIEPRFQSTLKFEPRRGAAEEHRALPLPIDRFGLPFGFVTPRMADRGMLFGTIAVAPLPVPLPSNAAPGGVQLDVQPWGAQVYVDGTYVGTVRDFTGYYHHLEVSAGPHVIAIVAPDYEPLLLDLLVSPGRVVTYRGTLSRASGH